MVAASNFVFGQSSGKKSDKVNNAKEQVMALAATGINALVKKDFAVLERILSDDFYDISPTGSPTSKNLLVEYFKVNAARPPELEAIDLSYSVVRIYDNTAVLRTVVTLKWSGAVEQAAKDQYYVTLIAVKKKGIWQIVATHESPNVALKGKEIKAIQ